MEKGQKANVPITILDYQRLSFPIQELKGRVLQNVDVLCFHISIKIKLTCKATQSKKKNNNPNWLGAKHTKQCIICYISCWRSSISAAHSFITTQAPPSQPLREKCLIPTPRCRENDQQNGPFTWRFFRKRGPLTSWVFSFQPYSW